VYFGDIAKAYDEAGEPAPLSKEEIDRYWTKALDRISRKEVSEKELREYLVKKGCPKGLAAELVERAKGFRGVDDERYAGARTRSEARKGKGVRMIDLKLKQAGIKKTFTEIAEAMEDEEWVHIVRYLEKRFNVLAMDREERFKLKQKLLRRGFLGASIDKALNEVTRPPSHPEGGEEEER
jgi:regulatory protein